MKSKNMADFSIFINCKMHFQRVMSGGRNKTGVGNIRRINKRGAGNTKRS